MKPVIEPLFTSKIFTLPPSSFHSVLAQSIGGTPSSKNSNAAGQSSSVRTRESRIWSRNVSQSSAAAASERACQEVATPFSSGYSFKVSLSITVKLLQAVKRSVDRIISDASFFIFGWLEKCLGILAENGGLG